MEPVSFPDQAAFGFFAGSLHYAVSIEDFEKFEDFGIGVYTCIGAAFVDKTFFAECADLSSDAVSLFEDMDFFFGESQQETDCQSGQSGTDDQDVYSAGVLRILLVAKICCQLMFHCFIRV